MSSECTSDALCAILEVPRTDKEARSNVQDGSTTRDVIQWKHETEPVLGVLEGYESFPDVKNPKNVRVNARGRERL